jgi:hypothetical protein
MKLYSYLGHKKTVESHKAIHDTYLELVQLDDPAEVRPKGCDFSGASIPQNRIFFSF